MVSAYKSTKSASESKRRNREKRKQKKLEKIQKEKELYGGRDFDDLKDNVKFGEVADAPPIFSKLPKARGRGKEVYIYIYTHIYIYEAYQHVVWDRH